MTVEPTHHEVECLVHRWEHLLIVKGGPMRAGFTMECWDLVSEVPFTPMPEWAREALAAGGPPSSWCPIVNPDLAEKVSH